MKIKNKLVPILTAVVLSAGLMPVTAFADEPASLPNQTIGENETNNQNSDGDAQQALVTITEQPQDASVNYPEGVTFQAAVDKPENVASWQWILEDTAGKTYELAGETATTDTLVLLSTSKTAAVEHYYCVITDTDGNTVTSEKAGLSIANQEESKPVLYLPNTRSSRVRHSMLRILN
jgi:hypothetical protein